MNVAHVVSERSLCDRDKVGAVVVSVANRMVDTGYNGPPRGMHREEAGCVNWCPRAQSRPAFIAIDPMEQDPAKRYAGLRDHLNPAYDDCPSIHAEANALLFGDRSQRVHGTIYITSGVCGGCAKLIANSGLARVVCDTSHAAPHRDSSLWFDWLRNCGLRVDEMKH